MGATRTPTFTVVYMTTIGLLIPALAGVWLLLGLRYRESMLAPGLRRWIGLATLMFFATVLGLVLLAAPYDPSFGTRIERVQRMLLNPLVLSALLSWASGVIGAWERIPVSGRSILALRLAGFIGIFVLEWLQPLAGSGTLALVAMATHLIASGEGCEPVGT